ncbi:MAG: SlyX family protein [Spirochaetes bacterium]|uniref:SlyX family protein n=1 Tax=Candidatus Ornithospirochaeta stercoravium TaxID=2840897 RepID=A0A9D9IAA5_9SPIO|nr:SlyX family protein [Candidatus Ornithospirochaeta stercoravium]
MNEDLERLEIKISYLESQNAELNDVVIDQGKSIAILEKRIEMLEKKVEDLIEESGEARPNRRPPHY